MINKTYNLYLFIIFGVVFLYGFQMFWIGFHNVDICHNEKVLSLQYDMIINEVKLSGNEWGLDECYRSGLKFLVKSIYVVMVGAFGLGYVLRRFIK